MSLLYLFCFNAMFCNYIKTNTIYTYYYYYQLVKVLKKILIWYFLCFVTLFQLNIFYISLACYFTYNFFLFNICIIFFYNFSYLRFYICITLKVLVISTRPKIESTEIINNYRLFYFVFIFWQLHFNYYLQKLYFL